MTTSTKEETVGTAFDTLLAVVDNQALNLATEIARNELVGNANDMIEATRSQYRLIVDCRHRLQSLQGEVTQVLVPVTELLQGSNDNGLNGGSTGTQSSVDHAEFPSIPAQDATVEEGDLTDDAVEKESAEATTEAEVEVQPGHVPRAARRGAVIIKSARGRKSLDADEDGVTTVEMPAGSYTTVPEYRPFILKAYASFGGVARYVDATRKAFSLMKLAKQAKPYDGKRVPSTNMPRYVSQCAALRKQLVKHGVLERVDDKTFQLTEAGREEAVALGFTIRKPKPAVQEQQATLQTTL